MTDKPDVPEMDETVVDEIADRIEVIFFADMVRQAIESPVHVSLEVSSEDDIPNVAIMPDPSDVMRDWDLSGAETTGEPINTDEYPSGTWFFFDGDTVLVGEAGSEPPRIIRKESRQALTQAVA